MKINAKAATGVFKPAITEESPYMQTQEKQSHATSVKVNQNASNHAQKKH